MKRIAWLMAPLATSSAEKSMAAIGKPAASARAAMMRSEVALLSSVETSVFHGFGASRSCPGAVVVVVEPLVEVDVVEDDEVEVELVVGITVDVEELVLGRDVLELEAV